jgi:hypothetical protein
MLASALVNWHSPGQVAKTGRLWYGFLKPVIVFGRLSTHQVGVYPA